MKKMLQTRGLMILLVLAFFMPFGQVTLADVAPGDVIDKSNWQKIEGMVPDSVLNWVKQGDFVLNIGKLSFDPEETHPLETRDLLETNVGKYALNEKDEIVDAKTGKEVFVLGMPFPQIDPKDPDVGVKVLYNWYYSRYVCGKTCIDVVFELLSRSGLDRKVKVKYLVAPYTGYGAAKNIPNPEGYEIKNILTFTYPFDIQGTTVMLWRFLDSRPDMNYSYVPAIRRVRRMSPASRSDAVVGSDFCMDDTAGYDGKIPAFTWKLIRIQETLVPWINDDKELLTSKPDEPGWHSTKDAAQTKLGYETEGWEGASWAPTNWIWIKQKAYVIQGIPKDPYYNYGDTYLWIEAVRFFPTFKIIYDRAKNYWKTAVTSMFAASNEDGSFQNTGAGGLLIVDERSQHATFSRQYDPEHPWCFMATDLDLNDFTLGGFMKYCK
jgi:hypothetical protein